MQLSISRHIHVNALPEKEKKERKKRVKNEGLTVTQICKAPVLHRILTDFMNKCKTKTTTNFTEIKIKKKQNKEKKTGYPSKKPKNAVASTSIDLSQMRPFKLTMYRHTKDSLPSTIPIHTSCASFSSFSFSISCIPFWKHSTACAPSNSWPRYMYFE